MTAGQNCLIDIIRMVDANDDVGGSYPTGTYLHRSISARLQDEPVDTAFLQQGLETVKVFKATVWGHLLTMREQDEIIVVSPPNHPYYNKRFRIVSHQISSNHPAQKRNIHILKLRRSQISHGEPYQ